MGITYANNTGVDVINVNTTMTISSVCNTFADAFVTRSAPIIHDTQKVNRVTTGVNKQPNTNPAARADHRRPARGNRLNAPVIGISNINN